MKSEIGSIIPQRKAIAACMREAVKSEERAKDMTDFWLDQAARLERELEEVE